MGSQAEIEVGRQWWAELGARFEDLNANMGRAGVRERVERYVLGLLGQPERKNGWQLAEQMYEAGPQGMQRLLNAAVWQEDEVRDTLSRYVAARMGEPNGIFIADETGFLKKGTKSAGGARQYSGTAGRIENCQIGGFFSYPPPQRGVVFDGRL